VNGPGQENDTRTMLRFDPKIVEKTAFPSGGEENLIGWLALGWLAG